MLLFSLTSNLTLPDPSRAMFLNGYCPYSCSFFRVSQNVSTSIIEKKTSTFKQNFQRENNKNETFII